MDPYGVVTGLYGDGGVGKSLVTQQLQTGVELGSAWLGLPVEKAASLGVYCEDDEEELRRRQSDINKNYCTDYEALASAHWMPRLGEDNILMTFARSGAGELTRFYRHVLEAALDLDVRLVAIDTAADTFGGNENDRNQVRQFVQRGLGQIALKIRGGVVCCAHPSRSGLASGEGDSGSTGWSNAFRCRAYLSRPKIDGKDDEPDTDERIITRRKANYASIGDRIKLRWQNGVLVPQDFMPSRFRREAEDVFLALLDANYALNREPLSGNNHAGRYAPRVFAKLPAADRDSYTEPHFKRAMEALFKSGKIISVDYGRPADERKKIMRKTIMMERV